MNKTNELIKVNIEKKANKISEVLFCKTQFFILESKLIATKYTEIISVVESKENNKQI